MLFVFLHIFPLDRYFFILIGGVDLLYIVMVYIVMVYTGHCQTSKMELFAKSSKLLPLTIFARRSFLDIGQGSE